MLKQHAGESKKGDTKMPFQTSRTLTKLIKKGKVRNIYDLSGYVFETSNRLSVFDQVIKNNVPYKGAMLNCINQFNKQLLDGCGIPTDNIPVNPSFFHALGFDGNVIPRLSYSKKLTMIPFEFVVRNYLVGSAYKAYAKGKSYCGYSFPAGLKEGSKLPEPIVTPTTKEESKHDSPITKNECHLLLTSWLVKNMSTLRNIPWDDVVYHSNQFDFYALAGKYIDEAYKISLKAFDILSQHCKNVDIVLIDTKFEFGIDSEGQLVLADEVGTPDSSRFASAEEYKASGKLVSMDKQIVRDYCTSIGFTGDEHQPIPEIPNEIWERVTQTYISIAMRLCGDNFVRPFLR